MFEELSKQQEPKKIVELLDKYFTVIANAGAEINNRIAMQFLMNFTKQEGEEYKSIIENNKKLINFIFMKYIQKNKQSNLFTEEDIKNYKKFEKIFKEDKQLEIKQYSYWQNYRKNRCAENTVEELSGKLKETIA